MNGKGESLSPLLYSLYVNDMEMESINQNCKSYELKMLNLYFLMYVDDMVIFSENIQNLQYMIDSINTYSNKNNVL